MVDVLEGIVAWFSDALETTVRAIETDDDCEVPRLRSTATYDLKDRQYPALEVLPDRAECQYSAEGEALDHEHWDIYTVFLYFTHAGQEARDVEYALLRYAEAVDRIVTADNTAVGRFNRVRVGGCDFGSMMRNQSSGELGQEMRITLTVRTLHT
jgi:hypothetical protein